MRWPTLSVPCGFAADGLPIGLQLVGAPFAEAMLLRAAHAYESATTWQHLGSAFELLRDAEQAGAAYDQAFRLDPLNASIRKERDDFRSKQAEKKP